MGRITIGSKFEDEKCRTHTGKSLSYPDGGVLRVALSLKMRMWELILAETSVIKMGTACVRELSGPYIHSPHVSYAPMSSLNWRLQEIPSRVAFLSTRAASFRVTPESGTVFTKGPFRLRLESYRIPANE
ncbi:hypothetical protein RRG08_018615 [Elysia crispata]|uniref:Uncharacterized protein n=1 Tax=Elysia crispata TaxID=231223 RepID=A0AAE1E414_9GAST|nr:hypothetical protein RRG08_018615 [Elysia crispata]